MDATLGALARLRRFAQAMTPTASPVDLALPAARALLADANAVFKLVGGVAVVHHGYLRTTEDIDVLIDLGSLPRVVAQASAHGFVVESRTRLRHEASGVAVDFLVAGEQMPRAHSPLYPLPDRLGASPRDPTIVGLAPLLELKLHAHRHRDLADVVELLQLLDDAHYMEVEANTPAALRPELATLRRDALEEKQFVR